MQTRVPVRIVAATAFGVALALIGQLLSPFHLLGHESSHLFVVLASFIVLQLGAYTAGPIEGRWTAVMLQGLGLGAGFASTMELFNQLRWSCNGAGTQAFFWVSWIPLLVFFGALGLAMAHQHAWKRATVFVVLVLATLAHDGLQQVYAARTVDVFVGLPLFLNQRADMTLPSIHVISRGWFLAVGVSGSLWLWAHEHRPLRRVAALVTGCTLLLTLLGGSHLGLGIGSAAIRQQLNAESRSEHFVIRYAATGRAAFRIEAIQQEAEWRYELLTRAWQVEHPGRIELLIFDDTDALYEGTGMRWAHATIGRASMAWWDGLDRTLGHELVHVLHADVSNHPLLLISPGYLEGTAMAFDDHAYASLIEAHAEVAAAHANGHLPPATDFLHPLGFALVNESNAYQFAGSFMGFLSQTYGVPAFLQFQRSLDYPGSFGKDLHTLDADWRSFLETVPRSHTQTARARERFDPARSPGIYDRQCPRLEVRRRSPEAEATAWADERAHRGAALRFKALAETDPDPRWTWGRISALQALKHHTEALALLATLTPEPTDQRLRKLNAEIVSQLALERWQDLYQSFLARRALEPPPVEREHLERLLHEPAVRSRLGPILLLGNRHPDQAREALLSLRSAAPDDPGWAVLLASRASPIPRRRRGTGAEEGDWMGLVSWLSEAGTCEAKDLERGFLHLLDNHLCDEAEALLGVIETNCTEGAGKVAAHRSRLRWAWEACQ